jgi:G3E family GTPase
MPQEAIPSATTPVVIIAGFLGAGKTTFLREILPMLADSPRPPYVILNDFANAEVDAARLRELTAEVRGIAAGCVCCDAADGLVEALNAIPAKPEPVVLIEANGTTDPYPLLELLALTPGLRERFGPVHQITVIHEGRWQKRLLPGDRHTERAQLRTASAIIANRGESATARQRARVERDIARLNPHAPRTSAADFAARLMETAAASPTLPAPDRSAPGPHLHRHAACRIALPPLTEDQLRQWLLALPRDILRIKGLARLSDTEMAYFNRTDDPFESPRIIRVPAQDGMEPAVVFIGPGLREDYLRASFHSTVAAPAFRLF